MLVALLLLCLSVSAQTEYSGIAGASPGMVRANKQAAAKQAIAIPRLRILLMYQSLRFPTMAMQIVITQPMHRYQTTMNLAKRRLETALKLSHVAWVR